MSYSTEKQAQQPPPPPYTEYPLYNQYPQHTQYPNNSQNVPPYSVEESINCCERNQKNKPQSNSVGPAALVFISGGMNMAWSFGFQQIGFMTTHMKLCWFISAIVGAIIGAFLNNRILKKYLLISATLLITVDGIILMSLSKNFNSLLIARYIDGFASGLIIAPVLTMIGEEAVKTYRGFIAGSVETMSFSLGIYLRIIYGISWENTEYTSFDSIQMQGALSIIYGVIGSIICFLLTIESPVFHLVRGEEQKAIESLRRLQYPYVVNNGIYEILDEHKRYIAFNKEFSFAQSAICGLPALLKLSFYRIMLALSFSLILCETFSITLKNPEYFRDTSWLYIILGTFRWLGVLIGAFMLDTVGRKRPTLFGVCVCGALAFSIAALVSGTSELHEDYGAKMLAAMILMLIFQFFAGIFIAASSAYLTEAYPLAIKSYYIAIAFICEMLIQIVLTSVDLKYSSYSGYHFALGGLCFLFFFVGIVCLPETKRTNLQTAQGKFSSCLSRATN